MAWPPLLNTADRCPLLLLLLLLLLLENEFRS